MIFPNDNKQYNEIKNCIKMLLSKKTTQRGCSLSKYKAAPLFEDFNWDDLIDYKIKPPFKPEVMDWSKNLHNCKIPFETALMVNHKVFKLKHSFYIFNFYILLYSNFHFINSLLILNFPSII